ncbi:MAG: hypothetical protein ABL951_05665 [Alphaproteobacteria bacterium]
MAANDYFDSADYTALARHTLGRSAAITAFLTAIESGFTRLPSEANLKHGKVTWGTFGGTANAHTVTLPYAVAYGEGLMVGYLPTLTNTTALSLNVNGLGVVAVKRADGTDLVAGDVPVSPFVVAHNGTNFRLMGVPGGVLGTVAASEAAAAASASSASSSATSAAASYDSFDDRYLGPKAADPAQDNDGAALLTGALYFNTGSNEMRVYSGSAWLAGYLPAGAYVTLAGNETITGVKTHTKAINEARATVASHATTGDIWGAAGNQIDWTGTATTTIFPNAPQAGAMRRLICAGACSFTAGANMLIDGVSSGNTVTCAANDTVVVSAVSTTQFKLTRIKYDGTAQASVGDHGVIVNTGNGYGSTNTKIRRYTTTQSSAGTAITYADSAANGGSFTINETGVYAFTVIDYETGVTGAKIGVSVNSAQLTTNIESITAANRLALAQGTVNPQHFSASGVARLVAGDVIRVHNDGAATGTSDYVAFHIRKVSA